MENEKDYHQKDHAKEKIILFVIGVLVGAVISTAAFLVCVNTLGVNTNSNGSSSQQMPGGTPPEMPSGENGQNGQGETPPEKPSNDSSSQNNSNNN